MTDRDLIQMRKRAEQLEVVEVEIVAGVDAQARLMGELRRPLVLAKCRCRGGTTPLERPRERLGVELDAVGAGSGRKPDRLFGRVDEQADADPERLQLTNDRRQVAGNAPASILPGS